MYHFSYIMHKVYPLIRKTNFPSIRRKTLEILQVNLGYKCNQRCLHCHVNAGPNRKEMMNKTTIDQVLDFAINNFIKIIDLTGGAPEMNEHFRYIVKFCKNNNIHVIDRCNLTILAEKGMGSLAQFLCENKVEVIASLPCYIEENVDSQRGKGVFSSSIKMLKKLNNLGYAQKDDLKLNLVYNPLGPVLPPDQKKLENEYKSFLSDNFKIEFNSLYTITNMPINRFGSTLISKNLFNGYMSLLKNSFSEKAIDNVMCKKLISVDYDGYVFDCDFNQMLNIPLSNKKLHISQLTTSYLKQRVISTADHCYGCTAGSGSSCTGSLT